MNIKFRVEPTMFELGLGFAKSCLLPMKNFFSGCWRRTSERKRVGMNPTRLAPTLTSNPPSTNPLMVPRTFWPEINIYIIKLCTRIYTYRVSQKTWEFSDEFSISSLLWIISVLPNFKSHNIIMSARVYFMKRIKDCKYVSIMSPQDEQWIRTSLLCLYTVIFLFY